MKIILALLLLSSVSFTKWEPDFNHAQQLAKEKHQFILLNFSGSDWCGPCIRMRKEIFDNEDFLKMTDTAVILVNADFPRKKKNQSDKKTSKQNEELADKYNPEGHFPYTVLLDENGKVIRNWDGLPAVNAEVFAAQVKNACDAHRRHDNIN